MLCQLLIRCHENEPVINFFTCACILYQSMKEDFNPRKCLKKEKHTMLCQVLIRCLENESGCFQYWVKIRTTNISSFEKKSLRKGASSIQG